jgi:hypothetical protein
MNFYAQYPGVIGGSNGSVSANGSPIPTLSTLVAGENPGGNQQPLQTDASGYLYVDVAAGSISAENPSVSPTGAAVPADATYIGVNVGGNLTGLTGTANGLKVDGSAVTQPISAVSLPLPTGAATNAELVTINTTLGSPFQAGGSIGNTSFGISGSLPAGSNAIGSVSVSNFPATQPVSGTVAATQSGTWTVQPGNTANTTAWLVTGAGGTFPVTGTVATTAPVNSNGSSSTTTVSTVATITKPANAVAFILQNDAGSTDYIRWCDSNSTASTTNGFVLQPGQDTGQLNMAHNLSICAHSGTQTYNIQWILSS